MAEVNTKEIDGRIQMLQAQRDQAMNHVVMLAGQLAMLQDQLAQMSAKVPVSEQTGESA